MNAKGIIFGALKLVGTAIAVIIGIGIIKNYLGFLSPLTTWAKI